jgi:hypothetical protein
LLEAAPDERGLELPTDAFDLRQLRHELSVVVTPRAPECPRA